MLWEDGIYQECPTVVVGDRKMDGVGGEYVPGVSHSRWGGDKKDGWCGNTVSSTYEPL